jgi:mannose/cellobiose epimerase-like protein (N-acyl-D-glucosamine 2-epimerase family)/predicted GH43/DUF377 family glycosyl hydrolase
MTQREIELLTDRVQGELSIDILPYWLPFKDEARGGFAPAFDDSGKVDPEGDKGLVMHTRYLWAYSAAYQRYKDPAYLEMARHAFAFLSLVMRDRAHGGFHWFVAADGSPKEGPKIIYGEAFAVYALARFYRATSEGAAMELALGTFDLIEGRARDRAHGGYYESVDPSWSTVLESALAPGEPVVPKSMNNQLHLLEAYTELYLACKRPDVREALESLLAVHKEKILGDKANLGMYFAADWSPMSKAASPGHDIEASWLMCEAEEALTGKLSPALVAQVDRVASATLGYIAKHGYLPNEEDGGHMDLRSIWWVQAECFVGLINAYQATGKEAYLDAAAKTWAYIEEKVVDREAGEWFWGREADGSLMKGQYKGGPWKACYHDSRACIEGVDRLRKIAVARALGERAKNAPSYASRRLAVEAAHEALVSRVNRRVEPGNGIFHRYENPVLTAGHAAPRWRFDYDPARNPLFMERLGINAAFNSGAIKLGGEYCLVARVEGWDRKSFFAVARSRDPVSGFRFDPEPILLPETSDPDVNVYDMRLTAHEDGWVYGLFCSERKDPDAPRGDTSSAVAAAGIVRTKDLVSWERLPDLKTESPQQRNVVLHPEFHQGKYLLYTRPQDGFIETGSGGGICWGLSDSMSPAVIDQERLLEPKAYHTIKESKNGAGATPIKTKAGWLHIAHGVRNTAAGLRYVVYAFMTALEDPGKVIARPSGYLIAPEGEERVGDVSNVCFCNGAIVGEDGRLFVYYASSDTRTHVAESSVDALVGYCLRTPEDGGRTGLSVAERVKLIRGNAGF